MNRSLKTTLALAAASAALAIAPASSPAIVGGHDAGPYPSVARITFGKSFLCTGTLITPFKLLRQYYWPKAAPQRVAES